MAVNWASTNGVGTSQVGDINNWFATPVLGLQNGQQFSFWTRSVTGNTYPDRLEVRLSTNGFSTNVGSTHLDVGDFTTLLLSINPTLLPSPGGYPDVWTLFTINLSGLPAGTTNGRIAFRYFVPAGGWLGTNSNYVGIDTADYNGAVIPPPTGSCCLPNGTCQTLTQNGCTATAGVYGGNGSPCGSCAVFGYIETTDVGDLPGSAAPLNGTGSLTKIVGTIDLDDVDMYKIKVCGFPNFSATTQGGPGNDTQLYLFDLNGKGITKDDDISGTNALSLVTDQFMTGNADVYLAVTIFERDPIDSAAQRIWLATNPATVTYPEWAPNGPGAANAVNSWTNFTTTGTGNYIITLTGACFLGGAGGGCYANCDGSTGTPVLTANDFQCFANAYAASASYANCDGSTGTPALTANDFQCFANAYAAGCT
jgi:hypothetical protein